MRRTLVVTSAVCALLVNAPALRAQTASRDDRLAALQARLDALSRELTVVRDELASIRTSSAVATATPDGRPAATEQSSFAQQVIGLTRSAGDGSQQGLPAVPQVLLQSRYSTAPLRGASLDDYAPNFRMSRAELRWTGAVNARWGAGVAAQYRAAPDNRPEQLLSDAFIDFYAAKSVTVRTGQFVKPFGFDIQQPDVERESPERAMFAGYVFPGERDRGVMVMGNLSGNCPQCSGVNYAVAVVNGNRLFGDSNRQMNYLFRARNVHDRVAYGVSVQLGTQITPPGVNQTNDEHAFGADAQWSVGRLGLRGEFVHANRPSTLFAPESIFAPAFVEGHRVRTIGTSATALWSLTNDRQLYLRFDRLAGDLIELCPSEKDGSCKVNAVNGGLRQRIAEHGIIGVDLQWKNRLSFNHDAVNTRVQVTSSLFF